MLIALTVLTALNVFRALGAVNGMKEMPIGRALGAWHCSWSYACFFTQTSNTNSMRQFSLIRTNMFIPYIRPNTLCIAMPFVVSCEIAR